MAASAPNKNTSASRLSTLIGLSRDQWAVGAGFLLLLVACAAVTLLTFRAREADASVAHTIEVRTGIARIVSLITDAEAAQRGYVITRDESYLTPLDDAHRLLPETQKRLAALTADNPEQLARLRAIEPVVARRMEVVDRAVDLTRAGRGDEAVALIKTGAGRAFSQQARRLLQEADAEEAGLFAARVQSAEAQRTALVAAVFISIAVAAVLMALVLGVGWRFTRALVDSNEDLKREIAARETAQAQLRQSQKMEAIGRLTGGLAHDFNNMLAIVIGSLDLAIARAADPERQRKLIDSALDGARRAAALTQRLLAFARQQPLDPRPIDINKSVAEMSQILTRTLGDEVKVETVQAAGLWRAFLDAPQLESAILNLAVNARDAMPGGGNLTIETANTYLDQTYVEAHGDLTAGQYVLIAVTDTGAGMSPDVAANAFEPFFTTKPAGAGTGLGLSQVHGFVKQSGGHVKLYSERDVGTTVKLYFPRLLSDEAIGNAAPAPAEARDNSARTVLVVEDEAGVRGFVTEALRELGYKVREAASGAAALDLLDRHPDIDLLLTDVVMPGMTGRQLADRAHETRPDLPVLYMTGYTRNAIVHNGVLDPGTHLLTKPFTIAELDGELRELLPATA